MSWNPNRKKKRRSIEAHEGSWRDFIRLLRRDAKDVRRRLRKHASESELYSAKAERTRLLRLFSDPRNLMIALHHIIRFGGKSPGPDGETIARPINLANWFHRLRDLQHCLDWGYYIPGPSREVQLPKIGRPGFRTLQIPNLVDRIVARALYQCMTWFVDPEFDENSFGYRPNRSIDQALRTAFKLSREQARYVWVTHDVKDAFGSIPQQRLFDLLRWLPDPLRLYVKGLTCLPGGRGIAQGSPLSPLLLNVYFDHFVDKRWRALHQRTPLLRYSDDILILCKSDRTGERLSEDLRQLLIPAGLRLPPPTSSTVAALKEEQHSDWLGYEVQMLKDQLLARIGRHGLTSLQARLDLAAKQKGDPMEVLKGWLIHYRPSFAAYQKQERRAVITSILECFELSGHPVPSRRKVLRDWRAGWRIHHDRWNTLLSATDANTA